MLSFKSHNIPISEKDLVGFYNELQAYPRAINTRVKEIGVIEKGGRSDTKKYLTKKTSETEIKTGF